MESVEEVYLPDGGELGHMTELVSIGKLIPTAMLKDITIPSSTCGAQGMRRTKIKLFPPA